MPQRDNKSDNQVVHMGNLTLSGTTPASSDWIDTRGFDAVTLMGVVNTVTDAGAAAGFSAVMEENDDTTDAGATTVDAAQILGDITDLTVTSDTADDSVPGMVGYVGSKRYVRLTYTGTALTDADVSVVGLASHAHIQPPADVGTAVAAT